jgi:hypothetical protein
MKFLSLFFDLLEPLFRLGQRWLGLQRLGWLFVAPNMLVFSLFCFLPIAINFIYAGTGGVQLMPLERPYTGGEISRSSLNAATTWTCRVAARTCSGARSSTPSNSACCRSR